MNQPKPIREYQTIIPGFLPHPVTVHVYPPGQAAGTESWCQLVSGIGMEKQMEELDWEEGRPSRLFAGLGLD